MNRCQPGRARGGRLALRLSHRANNLYHALGIGSPGLCVLVSAILCGLNFLGKETSRSDIPPRYTVEFLASPIQRGPGCSHVAISLMIIEDLQHQVEGLEQQRIALVRSYL